MGTGSIYSRSRIGALSPVPPAAPLDPAHERQTGRRQRPAQAMQGRLSCPGRSGGYKKHPALLARIVTAVPAPIMDKLTLLETGLHRPSHQARQTLGFVCLVGISPVRICISFRLPVSYLWGRCSSREGHSLSRERSRRWGERHGRQRGRGHGSRGRRKCHRGINRGAGIRPVPAKDRTISMLPCCHEDLLSHYSRSPGEGGGALPRRGRSRLAHCFHPGRCTQHLARSNLLS